jgi:hypothetical protein
LKRWRSKHWFPKKRSSKSAYRIRSADPTSQELVFRSKQLLIGNDNSCRSWNAAIRQHDAWCAKIWQIPTEREKKSKSMKWEAPPIYDSDHERSCLHRFRHRVHREHHGQRRQLLSEFGVLPGWLFTEKQLAKECQLKRLQLQYMMVPVWIRTANNLAKEWLHMIAFSPIFLTRALWFAERHIRLPGTSSKLTHQPSAFKRGLKSEAGSTVQLNWSNAAQENPAKSRLVTACFNWNRGDMFNVCESFGDFSQSAQKNCLSHLGMCTRDTRMRFERLMHALQPHKSYAGSRINRLETAIQQFRYLASSISTTLAIKVRTPVHLRPPKGCQSTSLISHLAVALAYSTHRVVPNVIRSMSSLILRRVFNVQRRLEMMLKVLCTHGLLHDMFQLMYTPGTQLIIHVSSSQRRVLRVRLLFRILECIAIIDSDVALTRNRLSFEYCLCSYCHKSCYSCCFPVQCICTGYF